MSRLPNTSVASVRAGRAVPPLSRDALVRTAAAFATPRAVRDDRATRDVTVSVSIYAHGGSAVVARTASGGIDALVR